MRRFSVVVMVTAVFPRRTRGQDGLLPPMILCGAHGGCKSGENRGHSVFSSNSSVVDERIVSHLNKIEQYHVVLV